MKPAELEAVITSNLQVLVGDSKGKVLYPVFVLHMQFYKALGKKELRENEIVNGQFTLGTFSTSKVGITSLQVKAEVANTS